jgi:hypothetical protein
MLRVFVGVSVRTCVCACACACVRALCSFVRSCVLVRTSERERAGGGEKWRGRRWRLILRQFIWFSEGSSSEGCVGNFPSLRRIKLSRTLISIALP